MRYMQIAANISYGYSSTYITFSLTAITQQHFYKVTIGKDFTISIVWQESVIIESSKSRM